MLTPEVLSLSIKGMKAELHLLRWRLLSHSMHNKKKQMARCYSVGANLAKKVIKLEKIISEMYRLKLIAELNALENAA
jgi:hypothetical protein